MQGLSRWFTNKLAEKTIESAIVGPILAFVVLGGVLIWGWLDQLSPRELFVLGLQVLASVSVIVGVPILLGRSRRTSHIGDVRFLVANINLSGLWQSSPRIE